MHIVEPDERWEGAAICEGKAETGVAIELVSPWLVLRGEYEHDGKYTVFYHATSEDEGIVGSDLGIEGETIDGAAWFGAVSDEAFQPELIAEVLGGRVEN